MRKSQPKKPKPDIEPKPCPTPVKPQTAADEPPPIIDPGPGG